MSALGHYLEEEGIPTTQISLVREHTAAMNPPRALWVPFMLGRPFGVPGDAAFQRRVLLAVLQLLERSGGPVLEDYSEEAPYEDGGDSHEGLACPVSFPRAVATGTLAERFADEISQLRVWHEVARNHRGRSTTGLTGLDPGELGAFIASWLSDEPQQSVREGMSAAHSLKLATDEVKAFYYEAMSVQPGRHSAASIQQWFWRDTVAGQVFLDLRDRARQSTEPSIQGFATNSLVPRAVDAARAVVATAGTIGTGRGDDSRP